MFREPLAPSNIGEKVELSPALLEWEASQKIFSNIHIPKFNNDLSDVLDQLRTKRSIIFFGDCGPFVNEKLTDINIPVFEDIQFNSHRSVNKINYYDQILLSDSVFNIKPDLVLIVGRNPVSKRFLKYLNGVDVIHYDKTQHKFDTEIKLKDRFVGEIDQLIRELNTIRSNQNEWLELWKKNDKLIENKLNEIDIEFSEISITQELNKQINKSIFYLSSSMPIRFMDMYFVNSNNKVFANRGVSGIDGVVSSSIGASDSLKSDVYLVIGDLAFIHDFNALTTLTRSKYNIKIILINNKGGGIFRFLPISEHEEVFEDYFVTPHNFNFKNMTQDLISSYYLVNTNDAFKKSLQEIIQKDGNCLIEVEIDNKKNFEIYKSIQKMLKESIGE